MHMRIKEVEYGGVFSLDRYENIRLQIRVEVESEDEFGKAVAHLSDLIEKTADIVRVVRRWRDVELNVNAKIRNYRKDAERLLRDAEDMRRELREEADKLVKNLNLAILPEDIRRKIEEDPINIFTCGLVSPTCIRIPDIDEKINRANEYEKRAKELEEKLAHYTQLYEEMRNHIEKNDIDKAWEISKEIWKFYTDPCNNTDEDM